MKLGVNCQGVKIGSQSGFIKWKTVIHLNLTIVYR